MDALSRRQHAAEEAWAREVQELAASAHRANLQKTKAGAERLERAQPPRAPAASMLPSIAKQYLRLGEREEVRATRAAARRTDRRPALRWPVDAAGPPPRRAQPAAAAT